MISATAVESLRTGTVRIGVGHDGGIQHCQHLKTRVQETGDEGAVKLISRVSRV